MNYLFEHCYTVTPEWEVLVDQAVVISDGKITAICPQAEIMSVVNPSVEYETIDCRGKLLIPGFINAHCHVPMTLLRGYGEGRSLHDWLFNCIFPYEKLLTGEDCFWGTKLGIAEMLASGVTSFSDMYMFAPDVIRAVQETGIKANISAFPSSIEQIAALKLGDRVSMDIAYHAVYTGSPDVLATTCQLASAYNCHIQVHVSETIKENTDWLAQTGKTPTHYLADCGLFKQPTIAAHCVHLNQQDIELMHRFGVHPCHCPSANLKLGSGIADVRAWLSAGLTACLGTDGPASNNNLNMLEEIHLAAMLQKGYHQDPLCMTPSDVLKMTTVNGARAQGRLNTGVMQVGYDADLALWDLNSAHTQPLYDILAALVYAAQSSDLELTMVQGDILYRQGKYLTMDLSEIIANCQRIKEQKLLEISQ